MNKCAFRFDVEKWAYKEPFRIAGYTREVVEVVVVYIESNGHIGRGEATGVRYLGESAYSMARQLEGLGGELIADGPGAICEQLPAGGARNAIDCALWDLRAKVSHRPVWQLLGIEAPRPLTTMFTCGVDTPEKMAQRALSYSEARSLKLKLTGEDIDGARVAAVRASRGDCWIAVDGNQSFTRDSFVRLIPTLVSNKIALIEQPFPIGADRLLEGLECPIPVAADESVQDHTDVERLAGLYQVINIKLDKCGGLTEGLNMARAARRAGLGVMVGCMGSTSLGIAPAFILGQLCDHADLDAPGFLKEDRASPVSYVNGYIDCGEALWGGT